MSGDKAVLGRLTDDIATAYRTGYMPDRFTLSHPEQRLPDGIVADDLLIHRVRIQRLPEINILLLQAGDARKQQAGRANWQRVEVLHIFRPFPRTLVLQIGIDELSSPAEPASVRKLEGNRIGSEPFERLAKTGHHVEVEDGIAIRLGPRQLPGKRSVHRQLIGQKNLPVAAIHLLPDCIVAGQARKLRGLQSTAD